MKLLLSALFALYLSFNYDQGATLELSDGSKWTIAEEDRNITSVWLTPMEIEITQNKIDSNYPYSLQSVETQQSVSANRIK